MRRAFVSSSNSAARRWLIENCDFVACLPSSHSSAKCKSFTLIASKAISPSSYEYPSITSCAITVTRLANSGAIFIGNDIATGMSKPSCSYRTRATSPCNCRNADDKSATRCCACLSSSRSRSMISFVPSAGRSCSSFTVAFKLATSCSLSDSAVSALRMALDACASIC